MPHFRLLVFVALAITSGCVPEKIVWLADSSGFVFTTGQEHDRIVHYDVPQTKWRIVVDNSRANTPWPGVRPEDNHIAVAKCFSGDKCYKLQVRVYNMEGRLVHESADYLWRPEPSNRASTALHKAAAAWCPKTDRILISAAGHAGYYDYQKKSLHHLPDDLRPVLEGPFPIRPDGAGFLATRGEGESVRLVFHRWTGNETEITPPETLKTGEGWFSAKWKGKAIILSCGFGDTEIDTETGTTMVAPKIAPAVSGKSEEAFRLRTKTVARCVRSDEGPKANGVFELMDLRKGGWYAPNGFDAQSAVDFCPSPDESYAAITLSTNSLPMVLIVSGSGTLLDLFARGKPKPASLASNAEAKRTPPVQYAVLAKSLSDPWFELGSRKEDKDSIQAIAEANAAILDLSGIATNDREIQFSAKEVIESFRDLVASFHRMEQLPKPPGLAAQFTEGFVLGFLGQLEEASRLSLQHRAESEALLGEGRRASAAFQRAHAAKPSLAANRRSLRRAQGP
jgi:hypothetical protein